jgi:hypothetical protein
MIVPLAALISILAIAIFILRVYLEDIFVGVVITAIILGATYWIHMQLRLVKQ